MLNIGGTRLELYPVGHNTDGAPESVLKGNVVIAGRAFHVEAIQVLEVGDGGYAAVNKQYGDSVQAVYTMADDNPLHAVDIDGREYLLAIFPHS